MRIFVAGATGVLGRHLIPRLVAVGHEVTATTRTPGKLAQLREAGAEPVVVHGLDREGVIAAVLAAAPVLTAPEGIVLRYGTFYGPGASDILLDVVRKRQVPVIGGGTGIWSFIEITDAAAATLAAVDRGEPGVYNVVDDDPAPVGEWLPYLAQLAGAKPPLDLPVWLGRLLAGEFVVAQMTSWRGCSNEKARRELGWEPRYSSWREGFRAWVSG